MANEGVILISCSRPAAAFNVIVGDRIPVAGWALAPAGVDRVEAILAGGKPIPLAFPSRDAPADVRKDWPTYPDVADCGYSGIVPIDDVGDGRQTLVIRVTGRDGQTAELPVPIEIDRAALETGRVLALVDRPIPPPGRAVVTEGYLGVRGWALSGAGIAGVEAIVGGAARGRLRLGMLRPDVPRAYPDVPGVEHSGFVGLVPVTDLPPGIHRVAVRVVGESGDQVEIEREFEVAPASSIFGQAPRANAQYAAWLGRHEPTEDDLDRARSAAASVLPQTTFSALLPVRDEDPALVLATVASLRAQVYPAWQVILAVDAAIDSALLTTIDDWTRDEPRISTTSVEAGADRGGRLDAALRAADGEFVLALEPGDQVAPLALPELARLLAARPDLDLVYADEDKIGPDGERWDPFFKPEWAPDLLQSLDYVGPFAAIRRQRALALGGYRADLPGAERYDLTLRVADAAPDPERRIAHLPRLLFSRYAAPPAAVPTDDAEASARCAVAESLARQDVEATVEPGAIPGARRVRRPLRERPAVTLLVPTGGKMHYLTPCLDSLLNDTTYPDARLLVVDNSTSDAVAALCRDLARNGAPVRREPFSQATFNFSAMINHGIERVETLYVVLLNDDMTVVTPDWIDALLEHAQRPDIGAVGAKLLYPDDTLQHAGVIFGPYGGSTHPFRHEPPSHPGYFGFPHVVREWSAVTFACAMLRTATFAEIGPLDAVNLPVAFNDADFCLRLRERGYRILSTPHAVLHHYESATKKVLAGPGELDFLRQRWGQVIANDPYYNPNLTRAGEDYSLDLS